MKISKIKIKNFRSIEELEIEKPTTLCAILWPNSAGKSNLLKAIDLVLGEWWTTKWKVSKELFYNPQEELKIEIYFSEKLELSDKKENIVINTDSKVKSIKDSISSLNNIEIKDYKDCPNHTHSFDSRRIL